jgi:hypothetical protein
MDLDSRTIQFKKVFTELGNKFNISKDIILYIYNLLERDKLKELKMIRNFQSNILSLNIIDPYISLSRLNNLPIIPKLHNYWSYENIYKYRIPIGKNLEWLIKCKLKDFTSKIDNHLWNCISNREKLLYEIKIHTTKNYLEEFSISQTGDVSIKSASKENIRYYLKVTEFRYLIADYYDYILWGTTLVIDSE